MFGKRNRKPFTESDQVPIKLLIPMTINIGVEAGLLTDNNGSISATYSPDNIFIINSPGAKQTSASDSDAKQKETPKQKNKGNSLQMKAFPVEQ